MAVAYGFLIASSSYYSRFIVLSRVGMAFFKPI
jgi:hypothetical protein